MTEITLNDYQNRAAETFVPASALYDKERLVYGLAGEVGEVAEKRKKYLRKDEDVDVTDMRDELGDVLWYLALISEMYGWELEEIAEENLVKLSDREERNVIRGSGDNR